MVALRVLLLPLFLLPLPGSGQTVRPVVVEHKEKARSRFELVNDTLFPLNVVVEARSFSLSEDGKPVFRPLDSHIQLKLAAMSFRVPPRQSYFVFYEAKAEKLPAWFVIYSTLTGFPRQSGLNIQVELPHTVYLLQKKPLEKSHVRVRVAEFDRPANRVRVELENTSPYLGRVLGVDVTAHRKKRSAGGFPLLPESKRRLEIPWDADAPPEKLVFRFKRFTLEQKLLAGGR